MNRNAQKLKKAAMLLILSVLVTIIFAFLFYSKHFMSEPIMYSGLFV